MNQEVIKAMNKKPKEQSAFRKWWKRNRTTIYRIILFPLWIGIIITGKIKTKLNSRTLWSESIAKEILDYYIPRHSEWDKETKTFYFFDNGYGWGDYTKKLIKRKHRRFWRLYASWNIRDYLMNKYELEGFEKQRGDCGGSWTELSFVMK